MSRARARSRINMSGNYSYDVEMPTDAPSWKTRAVFVLRFPT